MIDGGSAYRMKSEEMKNRYNGHLRVGRATGADDICLGISHNSLPILLSLLDV